MKNYLVAAALLMAIPALVNAETLVAEEGLRVEIPAGWYGATEQAEVVLATSRAALDGWPDSIVPGELVVQIVAMPRQFLAMMFGDRDVNDPAEVAGAFAMFLGAEEGLAVTSEPSLFDGMENAGVVAVQSAQGVQGAVIVAMRESAVLVVSAVGEVNRNRAVIAQIIERADAPGA